VQPMAAPLHPQLLHNFNPIRPITRSSGRQRRKTLVCSAGTPPAHLSFSRGARR
jgi:hypothetical protein